MAGSKNPEAQQRVIQQYSGALGEVQAVAELLHTGSAINGLTASDSGWDLHLHVPELPLDLKKRPRSVKSWELSGRTAHVQVKRTEDEKLPSLDPGVVRGWLTGTRAGTPTFVVVVHDPPGRAPAKLTYADPSSLSAWLRHVEQRSPLPKRPRLREKELTKFEHAAFAAELQLWARYPNALLAGMRRLDPTAPGPQREFEVRAIVEQLAIGYFAHHQMRVPYESPGPDVAQALDGFGRVIADALGLEDESATNRDTLRAVLASEATWKQDDIIVSGGTPLAAYTQEVDPTRSLAAAVECAEWFVNLRPTP